MHGSTLPFPITLHALVLNWLSRGKNFTLQYHPGLEN
jgi:hypothetical protein